MFTATLFTWAKQNCSLIDKWIKKIYIFYISSVQSLSHVWLSATPWTAACQASLSITNSCSLLKLMSIESVMPSNHLVHPLSSPSPPAFNLSQHQGLFKWVSSSHQVAKVLQFQLQHQSFQWTPRTDLLQNGLVGSPCSPGDSQESSPTPQFKHIDQIPYAYTVEVTNRFKGLDLVDRAPEELWRRFVTLYRSQWPKPPQREKCKRAKWLS